MNIKLLGTTVFSAALLLGACGNAEESVKESAKKVQETAKEEKAPHAEAEKALEKAKTYSDAMYMSKKGIFNQLTSKVDKFNKEDAQWAIDNLDADYKKNAVNKAKEYAEKQNMSKDAVKKQLTSKFDAFTEEEAEYAVSQLK